MAQGNKQAHDRFDPEAFFAKLRGGKYDWADLQRLIRASERVEPAAIISTVETRFAALRQLTDLEHQVIANAPGGWNDRLADHLRTEIRALAAT